MKLADVLNALTVVVMPGSVAVGVRGVASTTPPTGHACTAVDTSTSLVLLVIGIR